LTLPHSLDEKQKEKKSEQNDQQERQEEKKEKREQSEQWRRDRWDSKVFFFHIPSLSESKSEIENLFVHSRIF
jgi:MFS superfamily sulfate permease-like transporter